MNRKEMMEMVRKADAERTERKGNATRLYNIVQAMGNGEAVVWMWAVKTDPKTGKPIVKNVQRTRTDAGYTMVSGRFMRGTTMNTLVINWADYEFGHRHEATWSDVDGGDLDEMYRVSVKFGDHWSQVCGVPFLNGWEGTRYESVQEHLNEQPMSVWFNPNEHRWLDIILCMQKDSRVEFLLKAGMRHLVCPKLVRMLRKPEFFAWFRNHAKEVAMYTADELIIAHKRGISLADASAVTEVAVKWRGLRIGRFGITTADAERYCQRKGIGCHEYKQYLSNCRELGRTLNEHSLYPTHFHHAYDEADELLREVRRREDEANRAVQQAIANTQKRYDDLREASLASQIFYRDELFRRRADALCDHMPTSIDGWEIHFLFNDRVRKAEGKKMHNCIGSCYGGDDRIFTLTKDKVHVDVEVDDNGEVIQCRLVCNEDAPKEIHEVARKFGKLMVEIERRVA